MAIRLARCAVLSPPYWLTGLPAARADPGTSSAPGTRSATTAAAAHQYLRPLLIGCLLIVPLVGCPSGRLFSTSAAAPDLEPDGQLHRPLRQRRPADPVL